MPSLSSSHPYLARVCASKSPFVSAASACVFCLSEATKMELINWSINAIDKIFSTRSVGSGEPSCPDGTFAAGYVLDYYGNWKSACLSILSVEDVEDLAILGTAMTGLITTGFALVGIALVYRKIGRAAALDGAPRLPVMVVDLVKTVGQLNLAIAELNRKVDTVQRQVSEVHGKVLQR